MASTPTKPPVHHMKFKQLKHMVESRWDAHRHKHFGPGPGRFGMDRNHILQFLAEKESTWYLVSSSI